jgi:hypothetical protein
MTEDIIEAKTTDQLSDLLNAYCKANDLAFESADEVLLDVLKRINKLKANAMWLNAFILRWDAVQADEDFEYAVAMRGEK